MKVRAIALGITAVGLLALGLSSRAASDGIRIKGSGSGILETTNHPDGGWAVTLNITGQASHVGKIKAQITYSWVQLAPSGDNLVPGTGSHGAAVITTANGDQIFGTLNFLGLPTPMPGLLAIAGTVTVTGGTGRFEGATGYGLYVGTGDVASREVKSQIDGTLFLQK